jgi:stage V sporulation protein AE
LLDKTKLSPARILVGYVVAGVFLGAIGVYPLLLDVAGAGAATPLTGFGNLIAEGVRKAVDKDGLLGALTGGFSAAAAGIAAALCFGFLAALIFKGKNKP